MLHVTLSSHKYYVDRVSEVVSYSELVLSTKENKSRQRSNNNYEFP